MIGTYTFLQDGEVIARATNLITTEGKKQILRYLAGQTSALGEVIAVGMGATTPALADSRLTFELGRATVAVTSVDLTTQRVIFKGTLPQALVGKIYEIGLFSSDAVGDSRLLTTFDSSVESWTGATFNATNARLGADALRLAPATSATAVATLNNLFLDLSNDSNTDKFNLAFFNLNANAASIRIRFRAEDTTSYYEYVLTNPSTGYNVVNFTKSNLTKTGTLVDYSSIRSIEFAVVAGAGGAAQVDFDGLRLEDEDNVATNQILISRSLLGTPVTKSSLAPMDVEYALDVTV